MGIPGLMTYMNQHAEIYHVNYSLHNTFLVIDGNSTASQLYNNFTKSNCCFGGDYDKYAYTVSKFFDELLKCNITPLIIIDGGYEEKKIRTVYTRTKQKIQNAHTLTLSVQSRSALVFPLFLKDVFKNVALSKNIKCAQSLFEADDDIASIAKILDCPVLSLDSDFYIFNVKYIPFSTLEYGISRNRYGDGYVKNCKIYKFENFLQNFPGMHRTVLPLAATLLGNDYINTRTFRDFFLKLKLPKTSKRIFNNQQRRIEAVFRWLQKQTLDSAIANVLSKLDQSNRGKILDVMEMIINGYLIPCPQILIPLGFSHDYINYKMDNRFCTPYKFKGNIYKLKVIEKPTTDNETDLSCCEDSDDFENLNLVKSENERNLYKLAPEWFINEFKSAKFPSYFMDMLTKQIYFCPTQIEDFTHPTCINISLKIIRVIFMLLNTGTSNAVLLQYVARGQNANIATNTLECDTEIFSCKYPSLFHLRDVPFIIRKDMLNKTLGVTDEIMNEFPDEWRLYIASIKYWIDEAESPFKTNCHIHSILFAMLYHIVDRKIGIHRSQSYFDQHFSSDIQRIYQSRQNLPTFPSIDNISIYDALHSVKTEDCILIQHFFLSHFSIDQAVLTKRKKFNVSVVHAFSLLQNCIRHVSHLNSLLDYPYKSINIAEFFNGTLLYNLYQNFKVREKINNYISIILKNSPSLLQLYFSVFAKVQNLFKTALNNEVNTKGRRKNRKRCKNNVYSEDDDDDNNLEYHDVKNRFQILSANCY